MLVGETSDGTVGLALVPVTVSANVVSVNGTVLQPSSSIAAAASVQPIESTKLGEDTVYSIQWQGGSVTSLADRTCTAGAARPCSRINSYTIRMVTTETRAVEILGIFGAVGGFYGTMHGVFAALVALAGKVFASRRKDNVNAGSSARGAKGEGNDEVELA